MSTVRGKQITNKSIIQEKLNLVNPINLNDCATKIYVDSSVSVELNTTWDKAIEGLVTTTNGDLATNQPVTLQPISGTGIDVYVNGVRVQIGDSATDWGYFSPDGEYKRVPGNEREGDNLYWNGNVADYQLDGIDLIDYVYVVAKGNDRVVQINTGDTITYQPDVFQNLFTFNGANLETATVVIDGDSFVILNNGASNFTFDSGGGQQYNFTTKGENSTFVANGFEYLVIYDGPGSHKFTILPTGVEISDWDVNPISYEYESGSPTVPGPPDLYESTVFQAKQVVDSSPNDVIYDSGGTPISASDVNSLLTTSSTGALPPGPFAISTDVENIAGKLFITVTLADFGGSGWTSAWSTTIIFTPTGLYDSTGDLLGSFEVTVSGAAVPPISLSLTPVIVEMMPSLDVTIFASDLDAGTTGGVTPYTWEIKEQGANDSTYASSITYACADIGTNNVTVRVTDNIGQIATGDTTVTVQDNMAWC
jgi:hypothetical protein